MFGDVRTFRGKQPRIADHVHHSFVIGMIVRGRRDYRFGGQAVRLDAGMPYVVRPGCVHAAASVRDGGYEGIAVLMDAEAMRLLAGKAFPVTDPLYERLAPILMAAARDGLGARHLREIKTILTSVPLLPTGKMPARMEEARGMLDPEMTPSPPVRLVARKIGLSPRQLTRDFKRYVGATPHAFRNILKIQKAKGLLKADRSQAECAFECGYSDQSHLHRHFHRQVGFPPSEYRRKDVRKNTSLSSNT